MIKNTFILLAIVLVFFPGCKTYNRLTESERGGSDYRRVINERLKESAFPKYVLVENADFRVTGENSVSARITIYIEKDKRIFFAVKYLGFEIARGEVTVDSIKFINRLERKYFFGPVNDLRNYLPVGLDFYSIQRFIFTGFYYDNERKKDFVRHFRQEGDTLFYNAILNDGQKMTMMYNRNVKLDRLFLSDYIHHFLAEIFIEREDNEPKMLRINAVTGHDAKDVEIQIKDIKYRSYSRTDFKIGKNYTPLERLF